jgi:hypothetical protein
MMGQQVNISSAAESWSGAPQAVGANFMGAPHLGTVPRTYAPRTVRAGRRLARVRRRSVRRAGADCGGLR